VQTVNTTGKIISSGFIDTSAYLVRSVLISLFDYHTDVVPKANRYANVGTECSTGELRLAVRFSIIHTGASGSNGSHPQIWGHWSSAAHSFTGRYIYCVSYGNPGSSQCRRDDLSRFRAYDMDTGAFRRSPPRRD
jgi:hypothetical protein